jgi:hypothetical protein
MHIHFDPDEYEAVSTSRPCTSCNGYLSKCNGMCNGMSSYGMVRRSPEAIARIKSEKRRAHELSVLREAASIIASRGGK